MRRSDVQTNPSLFRLVSLQEHDRRPRRARSPSGSFPFGKGGRRLQDDQAVCSCRQVCRAPSVVTVISVGPRDRSPGISTRMVVSFTISTFVAVTPSNETLTFPALKPSQLWRSCCPQKHVCARYQISGESEEGGQTRPRRESSWSR